jgi:hypothetical protein
MYINKIINKLIRTINKKKIIKIHKVFNKNE